MVYMSMQSWVVASFYNFLQFLINADSTGVKYRD